MEKRTMQGRAVRVTSRWERRELYIASTRADRVLVRSCLDRGYKPAGLCVMRPATQLVYFVTICVFFFQAEDGIRDHCVTGVQTCALPISLMTRWPSCAKKARTALPRPW